jgi:hypothetical protein
MCVFTSKRYRGAHKFLTVVSSMVKLMVYSSFLSSNDDNELPSSHDNRALLQQSVVNEIVPIFMESEVSFSY